MLLNFRFFAALNAAMVFFLLHCPVSYASEKIYFQQGGMQQHDGSASTVYSSARTDSVLVMGPWASGAPYNGQFQAPGLDINTCQWNGWTSVDNTSSLPTSWHASTYNASGLNGHGEGNFAAWCGSLEYSSCDASDSDGGYGNNLSEYLTWETVVNDSSVSAEITLEAWLNFNVEPEYDFVHVGWFVGEDEVMVDSVVYNGVGENAHLMETIIYQPGDYLGSQGNVIRLYIKVVSDGGWSDEDCLYPSNGAVQIDDIAVTIDNGNVSYFENFDDGSLGQWMAATHTGVGDFASLRFDLGDVDPCSSNYSCQVNFIDDGVVVPGTGGSHCLSYCYGPEGYVVNTTGGLVGPDDHLDNGILSPVMSWPENSSEGCLFAFDIYEHEPLGVESPGIFSNWDIRSTSSPDPADIEDAPWNSYDFITYGEGYRRANHDVSSFLEPGTTFVQVRLGVAELGFLWGWLGNDASPAPYYDNVRVTAFNIVGPYISSREIDMANDGFPATGSLDHQNPGNNSVRFDMARNISSNSMGAVDPGDSIVIWVHPVRDNAILDGLPLMHYKVKPNPLFDPYRTTGLPLAGTVTGSAVMLAYGDYSQERFCFDLPDTGFFFPGDVMHYYFTAKDRVGVSEAQTSMLPADTLGFSNFSEALSYDQSYSFRALPSVQGIGEEGFQTPSVLFWDDLGSDYSRPHWYMALNNSIGGVGHYYDVYYTNSPSSHVGNGLGRLATVEQLAAYDVIVYASGALLTPTLANVLESSGEAPNLTVLHSWMALGNKKMFLAGDNVVSSLSVAGSQGSSFMDMWMGVEFVGNYLRPFIGGQATPRVGTLLGNPVFSWPETWIAFGGCPSINSFDAVQAKNDAVALAEFLGPDGSSGNYPYAAAVLKQVASFQSSVISLPYDLSFVWDDRDAGKASASISTRAKILRDALACFGAIPMHPTLVPDVNVFTTRNYPNPFNPKTTIEFNLPQDGRLGIRVFNIRGEQVRVLVDEVYQFGPGSVDWDGVDGEGKPVSAGVYFYEARTGGKIDVGKMVLVK